MTPEYDYDELRRVSRKHEAFAWTAFLDDSTMEELGDALEELDRAREEIKRLRTGLREIESWAPNWAQGVDENVDAIREHARTLMEKQP